MVISKEDYDVLFKKSNHAILKDKIIFNRGVHLASGGFLIDDEYIVDHSKERVDFLLSEKRERSIYMDYYGIDNYYFYGDNHNKGIVLNTSDIDVLLECLKIID